MKKHVHIHLHATDEFKEEDHPRDPDGKFGLGAGSTSKKEVGTSGAATGKQETPPQDAGSSGETELGFFNSKKGTLGGASLISSQEYRNDDIIEEKRESKDYRVQVSPEFEVDGEMMRVIMDGHHSLEAALEDGVLPEFEEVASSENDQIYLLEDGDIDDFLERQYNDSDWRNVITKKMAF